VSRNRSRLTARLGGPWRLYTHPVPGWAMLGTVQRGMDIGALAASPARQLAQINAGTARTLDQRKAGAAVRASIGETMAQATIPDGVTFAALQLRRDAVTGDVSFDWTPIRAICEASGIPIEVMTHGPEDNIASLITTWYSAHRGAGGEPDPVAEDLLAEMRAEDERGGGLSRPPGRA